MTRIQSNPRGSALDASKDAGAPETSATGIKFVRHLANNAVHLVTLSVAAISLQPAIAALPSGEAEEPMSDSIIDTVAEFYGDKPMTAAEFFQSLPKFQQTLVDSVANSTKVHVGNIDEAGIFAGMSGRAIATAFLNKPKSGAIRKAALSLATFAREGGNVEG